MRCVMFRKMLEFCGGQLLAYRPTPRLGGNPMPAVGDSLLRILAAILRI
jgi:hypothetical protein